MSNNDDADIPMTDTPTQHDHHSEEHDGYSGGEDVPAMVVTRERRQNAGNRMSKLLALAQEEGAEPEEEQYADIFQEAADDVEFEGEEGDEQDFNMDSSSEDEAEGEGDEDQGEKELKKELRAQSKKRKRESLLQHAMKRAATRIAPVPLGASQPPPPPADRPKKKSERVSWLPEQEINPVRSSRRSLAVQNKQEINDRLKEKEKHRLKTVEVMKAAEARKEAAKPKVLTQEQRLKEAALIEKRNSKSLNRWETNEKRRAAEQAERLAALKNRKLEGPIITYWSGQSTWVDGKLKRVGRTQQAPVQEAVQEKPKAAVTVKKEDTQPMEIDQPLPDNEVSLETPSTPAPSIREPASASPSDQLTTTSPATQTPAEPSLAESLPPVALPISTPPLPRSDTQTDSPSSFQGMGSFLDGIHMYAGLSPEQQKSPPNPSLQSQLQASSQITHPPAAPARPPKPPPGPPSTATRNLIILSDFDEITSSGRGKEIESLRSQLFGWSTTTCTSSTTANSTSVNSGTGSKKLQPAKKSLCAITGQEARYRDPVTGLGYVDAYALKRIRKVVRGEMRWSGVLGAFVGESNGRVARGVPLGF